MEVRKERFCVFLQTPEESANEMKEFQADAKIRVVLDYLMGLIQCKNESLVSLGRLVSLEARTL